MYWVNAGRLVSLSKPGDIDDQDDVPRSAEREKNLSISLFAGHFSSMFDPTMIETDGDWRPVNVGVSAEGGAQQVQTSGS
ncbi:MAG: hypothetical protein SGPRY_009622 [Prymnesium sp.]